ncbi:MAG: metal-dependent hydrolase, partial [Candidatus Heimdallarchaeota archaeon]|nr:metal-dependent hydrolase [Candidatus Heimdallarchaeota archaeon]
WQEIDVISSKLNDTWKEYNGLSNGYTWPNDEPRQRIDYIFHSSLISPESCSVISSSASDHLPVICEFSL